MWQCNVLAASLLENNVHSGQKFGGREPAEELNAPMASAIISSSALLSLGVMEHGNDSGWLEAISFVSLLPDEERCVP